MRLNTRYTRNITVLLSAFKRLREAPLFNHHHAIVPVDPITEDTGARRPVICILYANTGGGHFSAARAIEDAIHVQHGDAVDVVILNVPVMSDSKQVHMLYESYNLMLKADPRYAKHGLRLLNSFNVEKAVIPLLPRAFKNMKHALLSLKPDLVVSVHAIINHAAIRILQEVGLYEKVPYLIVCTDLTDNYLRNWANPDAKLAITFTEMARQQMIDYGMPAEKVRVIPGFPVNPSFFQQVPTRAEARAALGLDQDTFTILVSLGGMAIPSKTRAIVRALIDSKLPVQLLVICGMNRTLKRKMHFLARTTGMRIHVHGFTQRLPLMMAAADLLIAKPGPGTIMEAVIKELPMLLDNVTEPMPQEKGNLLFAAVHGIALKISSYRHLARMVAQLMTDDQTYGRMKDNMRRIKNENAIFEVADVIMGQLPEDVRAAMSEREETLP